MLEVNERIVRLWADELQIADLILAEQDFRLVHALRGIYADGFLAERLCLKGGTAINKLFLKETPRLSVDLDFNATGEKARIIGERKEIKEKITKLLREQDPGYNIKTETRYEQTAIHARYAPLFGSPRPVKLEISFVERFPVLGKVEKELRLPVADEKFKVATYAIEELAATKVRALYDRLKGRDIYDLYHISKLAPDRIALRKLVLYYFYRTGRIFNPKLFFKNVEDKFKSRKFVDDVSGFVRTGFSLPEAAGEVISYLRFLQELNERDCDFLALAGFLLKKNVAKEKLKIVREIKHPLAHLFGDIKISDFAGKATVEDIRVFLK